MYYQLSLKKMLQNLERLITGINHMQVHNTLQNAIREIIDEYYTVRSLKL